MTRKYLLIVANTCLSLSSKYYIVSVSDSRRGIIDRHFLEEFARLQGHFFHIMDCETSEFLGKIAESFAMQVYDLPLLYIKARFLVRYIKEHKDTPKTAEIGREAANFRLIIDSERYTRHRVSVIQRAEADKRKKPKSVLDRQSWT